MRCIPRARFVATAFLGASLVIGGRATADEFPTPKVDFSADSLTRISGMGAPPTPGAAPGQPMEITGKMYQSGEKSRQDVNMGAMQNVVINRRDKKLVWTIMPSTKSYMEFSADDPKVAKKDDLQSFWKSHDAKLEKIGKEEVNGVDTTHSKVTIAASTPEGHAFEGEIWLSKDNIPMRMKTSPSHGGEVVMELKNVKIGKQDAALFELPEGYNKMQLPDLSGLAGAAGAGAGAAAGQPGAAGGKPQMSPEQMKQLQEQLRKQLEQMQKNMPKAPPQTAPATP